MGDESVHAGNPSALSVGRLMQRVAELERRVEVLEAGTVEVQSVAPQPAAVVQPLLEEPEPAEALEPVFNEPPEYFPESVPTPVARPVVSAPFRMAALPYQPPPLRREVEGNTLERAIGLKLAGWIGALVVVVGAAMGVKFAHDAGWIGGTPPELRLVLMVLAAFGLIGAGEWVYRKVNVFSAVGLFAAGIALLFVVSYAGYGYLNIYGQTTAFVLMGVTALVGASVAARGRLVSIAIVALLGGNLTPLILGGTTDTLVPLLGHVLMLLIVGLGLAWFGATVKWWTVRWFALVTTALWLAVMVLDVDQRPTVFAFTLAAAALLLVEQAVSTWRGRAASTHKQSAFTEQSALFCPLTVLGLALMTVARFELSFTAVVWLVGYAAALTAACVLLRRQPAWHLLSKIFIALAAVLVVAAVPIALGGPAVVIVWSALAVAFVVLGVRVPSVIAMVASVVTWLAAVVHVVMGITDGGPSPTRTEIALTELGVDWPTWVLLSALLMTVGWVIGVVFTMFPTSTDDPDQKSLESCGQGMIGAGTFVGASACIAGLPAVAGTASLLLSAWLLTALDWVRPRVMAVVVALIVVAVAAAKWAGVDLLAQRLSDGWTAAQLGYTPVFNPVLLLGTLIAGSAVGIVALRRRQVTDLMRGGTLSIGGVLGGAAALIGFVVIGLCIEADRIVEAWRVDWTLLLAPGHTRQLAFTMIAGLGLLAWVGVLRWRVNDPNQRRDWLRVSTPVPILVGLKFLAIDVCASRLFERGWGMGRPVLNLETATAAVVMGGLAIWLATLLRHRDQTQPSTATPRAVGLVALLVGLVVGAAEVWRITQLVGFSGVASQVSLSVWAAVYAIGTIVAGFGVGSGKAVAGLRHFGLILLALTCVKVFIIDLGTVSAGWRTVSFILLGLLLLTTSVVYGRFSPKLLAREG